jgi:hypothetical protein
LTQRDWLFGPSVPVYKNHFVCRKCSSLDSNRSRNWSRLLNLSCYLLQCLRKRAKRGCFEWKKYLHS